MDEPFYTLAASLIIPLLGMILPILAFYARFAVDYLRGFRSLPNVPRVILHAGHNAISFVMPSSVSPLQPDAGTAPPAR